MTNQITITLTKNEQAFIHRRLQGMTFYEQNIMPKIAKAIPNRSAIIMRHWLLPYRDKERHEPETIANIITMES